MICPPNIKIGHGITWAFAGADEYEYIIKRID